MSIPETTSAEAFWRYAGGKCLFESRGEAWRDIKAWLTSLPPTVDTLHLPAVSEPFLAWVTSGEVDFQEREDGQPWITNRIRKGSFFLTTGGLPTTSAGGSTLVASTYGSSFGVPAIFGRSLFAELTRLEGAAGAKQVIKRHGAGAHFVPFPGGEVDVDTPDDFSRLTAQGIE